MIGNEILSNSLHIISQIFLIPVIIVLLIFIVYATITLGSLIYEYYHRKEMKVSEIEFFVKSLNNFKQPHEIKDLLKTIQMPKENERLILNLIGNSEISFKSAEALARSFIEKKELDAAKIIEKTDIVTRLGPTLGLMGTLIPLGPGLAALGAGDIRGLSEAIIIAFDTTVIGLAAGGIAYTISKIRRRWYEESISNLYIIAESVLEMMKNAQKKENIDK
ncbi:MAG: MotA/TolQ/ExbB proton channel family protein [Methanomicrobiales archaeon]